MKRRLSLGIATIGDPSIVLIDEPTTGLDPVCKKLVWAYIEKFKRDRVIIMVKKEKTDEHQLIPKNSKN